MLQCVMGGWRVPQVDAVSGIMAVNSTSSQPVEVCYYGSETRVRRVQIMLSWVGGVWGCGLGRWLLLWLGMGCWPGCGCRVWSVRSSAWIPSGSYISRGRIGAVRSKVCIWVFSLQHSSSTADDSLKFIGHPCGGQEFRCSLRFLEQRRHPACFPLDLSRIFWVCDFWGAGALLETLTPT